MAAQLPVSIRSLFQRKQNLGRPPADEDRGNCFLSLQHHYDACLLRKLLGETTLRIRSLFAFGATNLAALER